MFDDRAMLNTIRAQLLSQYGFDEHASVEALGSGLINDTYLVKQSSRQMVLQRINRHVFPQPEWLISNAKVVAQNLRAAQREQRYPLQVVEPVATVFGQYYVELHAQGFWRAISVVDSSVAIDAATRPEQVRKAATAFGHFNAGMWNVKPESLYEVIPQFHDLHSRLSQLKQALNAAPADRLESSQDWCEFALSQTNILADITAMTSLLPTRICHNDTKLNNMLVDIDTQKPVAIIDLDTCMPGYLMYDFGDMVRSMCVTVQEDGNGHQYIGINETYFAAAVEGYLSALAGLITPLEKTSLWLGLKAVTLELAVRFLTDYLQGDQYFHCQYSKHNFDRGCNQLTLYQHLLAKQDFLSPLIA